jgi:hypothetical protein
VNKKSLAVVAGLFNFITLAPFLNPPLLATTGRSYEKLIIIL